METCVRGFSFMPKENVSTESLQYIEEEELTRKWRASHRERQRQREQKIWDEFVVKENDVLSTVCKDDPYQFLEQLPEDCLKELMEIQLTKLKKEKEKEDAKIMELSQLGGDSPDTDTVQDIQEMHHVVTFAEEMEQEDEVFHIFDDDKEDDKISGAEDEAESLSPSTVRSRCDTPAPSAPSGPSAPRAISPDKGSTKSSENVTHIIENSIYFAKVKDLRIKISEELANIVMSLELRDIMNLDPSDLVKMCRRSSEFSTRFNRVHMYQLKRQISDLERNNNMSLPFAKHTQFQAQMVRISSLHQNLLQALQVFHKSIEQTACVRESIDTLRGLVNICREGHEASLQNLTAAGDLSSDKVIPSCDVLDEAINEYASKLSSYIDSTENTHTPHSRRSSKKGKMSSHGTWSKSGGNKSMGSDAGTRLSMYSLDTLRINLKSKKSKEHSSVGTSKFRAGASSPASASAHRHTARKRSPRSLRPLMRDPDSGRSKAKRKIQKDAEITTMVETVGTLTCTSSRVSCDLPPLPPLRSHRQGKDNTPRSPLNKTTPRRSPSKKPQSPSPTRKPQSPNLKRTQALKGVSALSSRNENEIGSSRLNAKNDKRLTEVQKQPEKKGKETEASETPRHLLVDKTSHSVSETPRSVGESYLLESNSNRPAGKPVGQPVGQPVSKPVGQSVGQSVKGGEMMTSEKQCEIARERNKANTLAQYGVDRHTLSWWIQP